MDELAQVLANTQEADTNVRVQAELAIKQAENNPAYPGLLTDIACSSSISTQIRQSALSALRRFIVHNWSQDDFDDDTPRIPISDEVKISTRQKLLELATGNDADRLVKAGVSYVVGKIASVDYPEQWPDLLPNLLAVIPTGTDVQLHGALRVLSEMVDGSLSEDQFFLMARQIVEVLYGVALNNDRKPQLRALAISIFRSSFDLMDMVKEDHLKEVKGFAEEALKGWLPFFHDVMKMPIPSRSPETQDQFNGVVALKLQVVKALIKIRSVFPSLLLPQSLAFFEETWAELNQLSGPYAELYIENDNQGRLENADGLPYTLDFLALEELDLLNQCMRASPVQKQLEAQLQAHSAAHETPWMIDLMKLTAAYARIIREEEDLWDIDVSLYLAEETSVTANYTARTACGDMLIKLGEWIGSQALEGLFAYTKTLFADGGDWRNQEAALYLFTMIINDFLDCEKQVPPQIAQAYMELVTFAIGRNEPLLQARGFLVAGILGQCYPEANVLLDRTILAITQAESELVQVACVKAVEGFTKSPNVPVDRQVQILQAVDAFLSSNDLSELDDADDLLVTLAESLRAAIRMNASIVITSDVKALDLLFLVAKHGATNFQITMLVNEAFEEIVQVLSSGDAYAALCSRVVPTLTGAFNVADLTQDEPLVTFATELISVLIEYGPEPLPAGLVAQLGPKLKRLLMESNEGEILRPGASALKFMLMHDHQQVFSWQDEQGHSGLEVCLHIIARLLNPAIEDNSASEVGGLAAELVEKAGHERLGNNLRDLLQAVATRLASAEAAPFIQSLILVFARLCLNAASDVVEFLGQIDIGGHNGLQIVLSKWLENSINFTGYDEIRQNVIALSKLYSLNDPRIAQTQVKGDLIVPASDRIVTRSRSKQSTKAVSPLAMNPITDFFTPPPKDPDQYTIVAAPLKILKVLIEELLSAQGHMGAASSAAAGLAAAAEFDDEAGEEGAGDDDGWEDEPDTLDLALGGSKRDWLSQFESGTLRTRDDETQAYLTEFFLRAARENEAGFQDWYAQLSEEEKGKLNELAGQ